MKPETYKVLGVMSGTSRDGIDLACVELSHTNGLWAYRFIQTDTVAYNDVWKTTLARADKCSTKEIKNLNREYTHHLAGVINTFIAKHELKDIDAVCSHGHTVFHQPERQYTLQIGNLPQLADLLHQKVVCDFRVQDVQLGGQGAPLVPIGDQLLFADYAACINLGGFANISSIQNGSRLAYDICAVNTVLNHYAEKCGFAYDDKGNIARKNTVDAALLQQLNQLDFYKANPPKSLGIEWVKAEIFPLLEKTGHPPEIILATYTQHVAQQLAAALTGLNNGKVLFTGGGVYNNFLMETLQQLTTCLPVIPEKALTDYKEALIFGLLGVLKLRHEPNVLKSVTGAKHNHSSGVIYQPTRS